MGKLKPFLFGTIFGGGLAFVALQYHLVQSADGFRLVPRTPQPSIGLAYADVRDFGMQEWADRPELAQAIMAHGSTDLITTSAKQQITNTIAPHGSTLDKVRSLLQETEASFGNSTPGESDYLAIPRRDEPAAEPIDLLSIPLTQNTGNQPLRNSSPTPQPLNVARRDLPSVDDIFQAGANSVSEIRKPISQQPTSRLPSSFDSVAETEAMEDMLFGYDKDPKETQARKEPPLSTRSSSPGVFEVISTEFEQRAVDAFSRAKTSLQSEASNTLTEKTDSFDAYLRGRVKDSLPESVSSMFGQDAAATTAEQPPLPRELAPALKAIQDGFDPFIR